MTAISCYQCNSRDDHGCSDLDTLPHIVAEYYKPCEGDFHGEVPFCRKTDLTGTIPCMCRFTTFIILTHFNLKSRKCPLLPEIVYYFVFVQTKQICLLLELRIAKSIYCINIYTVMAGDLRRTIRSCGWIRKSTNALCYKADNDDHLETVCQCFEDGCNSATGLRRFSIIAVLLITTVLAYF